MRADGMYKPRVGERIRFGIPVGAIHGDRMIPLAEWRAHGLLLFLGRGAMIIRRVARVMDLDEALRECVDAEEEIEWCKVMRGNEIVAGFVRRGGQWLLSAR